MNSAETYDPKQSFSLLIQGPPKSRKTSLAVDFVDFGDIYVADLDNNMSGTMRWRREHNLPLKGIFYDTPDIMEDSVTKARVERPYQERLKFLNECLKAAVAAPNIRTLVIDGLSKLNSYIIGDIGRQKPKIGEKNPKDRREGQMSLEDWTDHLYLVQNIITKLQATDKMTIFTAHEEASDRTDISGWLVSISGKKAQAQVPGMFSDVWHTEVKPKITTTGTQYVQEIRTMTGDGYNLGSSLGLPTKFDYSWPLIKAAINKGFGEVKK